MNKQEIAWEREYKNPKLVSKKEEPQADTLRFFKFLKKEQGVLLENLNVLDLGCGTGRNSNYLAGRDNDVVGIEFSKFALNLARERARENNLKVKYILGDIGKEYEIKDSSIDLVLDITSSNSLDEKGREVYLKEVFRVLKPGGYFFVRALAKEGNKNVKNLLKQSPGREKDTYILKEIGLTERVFTRKDFIDLYSKYFEILKMDKKTNYSKFNGRVYKRDYLIVYLKKN
ncbi:MAG: class I SAM-dependent methyltransferase [Patescibacteria group bacterium]